MCVLTMKVLTKLKVVVACAALFFPFNEIIESFEVLPTTKFLIKLNQDNISNVCNSCAINRVGVVQNCKA